MLSSEKNNTQVLPELSGWRKSVWPVFPHELKKFIPMVVMMFWILFNYTVVRNIKDTLLINAVHSDEQVLPWAKVLGVTPASIIFVIIYAKLSNVFSREKLFYVTLSPFIIFFSCFPFILYPLRDYLHASPETLLAWKTAIPVLRNGFPVIAYWSFSAFYIMAELWGNVAVALLFWQFANQITPTSEAKRFYPIFGFWSNLGLVSAGFLLKWAEPILEKWDAMRGLAKTQEKDFSAQVQFLCSFVVLGCAIVGLTYWWMNKYVLSDPRYSNETSASGKKKKTKPKMSIGESVKFLSSSKYLGYITILVLAYGIVINLVEVSWKGSVKQYFNGDETQYMQFMGNSYISTGLVTMFLIMFSQNILRRLGWRFAAEVTPWVSLITGAGFFIFLIFQKSAFTGMVCNALSVTPVWMAMWLGLIQNCLTKGAKYSLFDPTKEMAYIPLDEESKIKGKAAIDVIGGRAGKSGGGVINMILSAILGKGSFLLISIGSVMTLICFWWIWAVEKLSGEYHTKLKNEEEAAKTENLSL